MSPDVTYLLYSVILCFVQVLIAATGANTRLGLPALAGNREGLAEIKGWAGRARRAHLNMIENLVLFASLVLIAAVAGKANATTAMGAMIFFWARVAYAIIYLIGIPWLRTLAWAVSVVGMAMIVSVLL
ncbi:MAG: MAPEG family protein [Alphaproteobacteria bacterium]|nr:MAPEG family protein [Alphaproteobacteria bacterium]MBV8406957.1 MAPEG family protein [Alphaproteobacteria bacterium]